MAVPDVSTRATLKRGKPSDRAMTSIGSLMPSEVRGTVEERNGLSGLNGLSFGFVVNELFHPGIQWDSVGYLEIL